MATRRSNALQLFVYMSRTKARGTSAFLRSISFLAMVPNIKARTCSLA